MLIMIFFSFQLEPFSSRFKQILTLEDRMDLDSQIREVSLKSDGEIGDGSLTLKNTVIPLREIGREMRIQGIIEGDPLRLNWSTDEFLDRRLFNLTIATESDPDEISIQIYSQENIVLYDCPFPYEIQPDLKSAQIFIGINPPMPLNIPIIFSRNSKPSLSIKVVNNSSDYKVSLQNSLVRNISRTVITKTLTFDAIMAGMENHQ